MTQERVVVALRHTSGHRQDYLKHLQNAAARHNIALVLVTGSEGRINALGISLHERSQISLFSHRRVAAFRWHYAVIRAARRWGASRVVFPDGDDAILASLVLWRFPKRLLIMRPYWPKSWLGRFRHCMKILVVAVLGKAAGPFHELLYLVAPGLKVPTVLRLAGAKPLDDPVPSIDVSAADRLGWEGKVASRDARALKFLICGSITTRKRVKETLRLLHQDGERPFVLAVAGQPDSTMLRQLEELRNSDTELIVFPERLADGELVEALRWADFLVLNYSNVGASGLLGLVALYSPQTKLLVSRSSNLEQTASYFGLEYGVIDDSAGILWPNGRNPSTRRKVPCDSSAFGTRMITEGAGDNQSDSQR